SEPSEIARRIVIAREVDAEPEHGIDRHGGPEEPAVEVELTVHRKKEPEEEHAREREIDLRRMDGLARERVRRIGARREGHRPREVRREAEAAAVEETAEPADSDSERHRRRRRHATSAR